MLHTKKCGISPASTVRYFSSRDAQIVISQISLSFFFQVCTEGHLTVEFGCDNSMRIRHWRFLIRQHQEFIPRSSLSSSSQDQSEFEQLSKNITRQGLSSFTMNYLRVSGFVLLYGVVLLFTQYSHNVHTIFAYNSKNLQTNYL